MVHVINQIVKEIKTNTYEKSAPYLNGMLLLHICIVSHKVPKKERKKETKEKKKERQRYLFLACKITLNLETNPAATTIDTIYAALQRFYMLYPLLKYSCKSNDDELQNITFKIFK